jgi:hypothetical protein
MEVVVMAAHSAGWVVLVTPVVSRLPERQAMPPVRLLRLLAQPQHKGRRRLLQCSVLVQAAHHLEALEAQGDSILP